MQSQQSKRGYSRKVKALGATIILVQIATVIVFLLAIYSNGVTVASVVRSIQTAGANAASGGSNNPFNIQNLTINGQIEQAIVLPNISNSGILPVTLNFHVAVLNGQNQIITSFINEDTTIGPGHTSDFIIPLGALANVFKNANGVRFQFEISSIYGLLGAGATATVNKQ